MGDRLCPDDMQGKENHEGGRIINGKLKYARREEGEGGEMRRYSLVGPEYYGNYSFLLVNKFSLFVLNINFTFINIVIC